VSKVLVFGASGMLGNAMLRFLAASEGLRVWGTVRSASTVSQLPAEVRERLITGVDVERSDHLVEAMRQARPEVVVNCIGLVKQLDAADDPLEAIPINSLLPHRLARLADAAGARLVHISTDCVFDGTKGNYRESDVPDAKDLYGRSKLLGEVDYPNAVTLRTSIIGHELEGARSLIGWFLAQEGEVEGFSKAVFSGLPTVELARVVRDFVIPNRDLRGLYHVAAEPIDKFALLRLVAEAYGKSIAIRSSERVALDRSLDSSRFRSATGYQPPAWPELIETMERFR
jgi:dTDP-4-dehydrorhamnose reductase